MDPVFDTVNVSVKYGYPPPDAKVNEPDPGFGEMATVSDTQPVGPLSRFTVIE